MGRGQVDLVVVVVVAGHTGTDYTVDTAESHLHVHYPVSIYPEAEEEERTDTVS